MDTPNEVAPPVGETPPLAVKGTPAAAIQAMLISVALALVTVMGALGTTLAFVKTRDLNGWIAWMHSSEAASAITALSLLGGIVSIGYRSLQRKWREIYLATHTPNSVAYVVGQQTPEPTRDNLTGGNF